MELIVLLLVILSCQIYFCFYMQSHPSRFETQYETVLDELHEFSRRAKQLHDTQSANTLYMIRGRFQVYSNSFSSILLYKIQLDKNKRHPPSLFKFT